MAGSGRRPAKMTPQREGQDSMTGRETSLKQIEANRRNAVKSTGPGSAQGKAVVGRNARKHGVLARQTLIPGEDAEEFGELEALLAARLRPEGVLEQELFDEFVAGFGRLRRLRRVEVAVFAAEIKAQSGNHGS